ncbi:Integrin beta pat-3 [Hypsibius exemplaris]|uniref:Integrin beta n=1 Tax=Hypsibius exemplaris TaxID=2072580 RepID=A0A1W0WHB7_HYPEX|nr:Integrin beta pat-3 [Hypsibius exemplaris]
MSTVRVTAIFLVCFYVFGAESVDSDFSSRIRNPCRGKLDCQECIQTDPRCAWCANFTNQDQRPLNTTSDRKPRCDYNESSSIPRQQLQPHRIRMKLRPGQPQTFSVTFIQAEHYPLDIYFLLDMSATMRPYKEALAKITEGLAKALEDITSNVQLGFGSFVDKPTMPFTMRPVGDRISPCNAPVECVPTYGFKHHLKLRANQTDEFKNRVKNALLSGNLDAAEGGLDALMQTMVCKDTIGWRNGSRKLVVFFTDGPFHYAGEGKLAGIILPNDRKCHMDWDGEDWMYSHTLLQDYPSVGEINLVAQENNVNIIFAVPEGIQRLYKRLSAHVNGSTVGHLTSSADSIIQIVKAEYNKITSSVQLREIAHPNIKLSYQSSCLSNKSSTETSACDNLRVGSKVEWNVTVELLNCLKGDRNNNSENLVTKIHPLGLSEELILEIEPLCQCDCQKKENQVRDAGFCSGQGHMTCGACVCHAGFHGANCACDLKARDNHTADCTPSDPGQGICSGRGACNCGQCDCFEQARETDTVSGKFCEVDDFSCEKDDSGQVCSGHGTCKFQQCSCDVGYSGSRCECPEDTTECVAKKNGKICNGKGSCKCGRCSCNNTGLEHPAWRSVPERARGPMEMRQFVMLNAILTRWRGVDAVDSSSGFTKCPPVRDTTDFCSFTFGYAAKLGDSEDSFTILIERGKDCPKPLNLYALLGGLVGSILLAGVLLLLAWKVAFVVYDRRQLAKFRREIAGATWQPTGAPVHRPVRVAFQNPNFRRRSQRKEKD